MTTGLGASSSGNTIWRILEAATATNSPPSGSSAGVANPFASIGALPGECTVAVYSTAGSGTMTVTVRLWGYLSGPGVWLPLGTGADASKGTINAGAAIGETGADTIRHAERIAGLFSFDRVYSEITAIGGTATAVNVDAVIEPQGR